jgi:hypothetical protein
VLFVTARGLTTGAMPYRDRALQIDFDFCTHALVLQTSDARAQRIALGPMATADFHAAVMTALRALDVDVRIWTMPVEIEGAIPFDQDRIHASYDAAAVNAFWRQLVQADRVFNVFRARFLGKTSARASASGPAMAATAKRRFIRMPILNPQASAPRRSRRGVLPTAPKSGNFSSTTKRSELRRRPMLRCSISCRPHTRRRRTEADGKGRGWSATESNQPLRPLTAPLACANICA